MADTMGVVVTGPSKVELRFDEFPEKLRANLLDRITGLTGALAARIRGDIHSKTGKLRGEVIEQIYDDADQVSGRVTVSGEFAKAAALEWGAHGSAKVAAHRASLDHLWTKRLNAPITVMVAAHSRQMNVAQQRIFRGPLAEMEGQIVSGLTGAVDTTIASGES